MTSPYGLEGRVALVTGGTRGIGLAVAEALTRAGARVCVTARDPDGVRRAAEELGGVGLAGSVADPAHLSALTEFTLDAFGRLDIVVNNAATNQPYGPLMDADPDTWREAFTVNVEAPLRLTQCVWRAWMREHGGTVINICTEGATHVGPHVGAYGTSKSALLHLTQQLAGELAPKVRVNSVSPGLVRTEMARFVWEHDENTIADGLPLGRIGEPEDIARAVLWLASDASEWVTGTDLLVDGGTRVRPAKTETTDAVLENLRRHKPT
ncbi:SDR family oxidoreductase [Streptomyces turgidiscabies]|uniref:Oxidoreductase, short chain dehydrogenase/reductase family protein n=1 Tax=Streptomyces turgidiscabies (strain Car8) TaxID=698760 RepID=L7F6Q2_STRT8|nr:MULTISPECIES: SDR family oxidoreductase [Streptomyces]ELP67253.1 oxidoreductase, short chain dehydrogenase/reductase family protein [Streptomyces turgidiscabies Car8]MDX3491663.1 SDR family oxidoreductase [Streptomyces turgidiscabies]GAQ73270.1 3-oxoacyl-[acyl-carrier-protein] reductase FabG [Streptomyces turgidiscabies]